MIRAVVLDLDGTVYRSGRPLPGAVEAVARLVSAGVEVVFASNNPTVTAAQYAVRLRAMGVDTDEDRVLTSGGVAASWLREHHGADQVLLLSEPSLRAELDAAGVHLTDDPAQAAVVVASFDRTFDYTKWTAAFTALRAGALFVATNPDVTCPVEGGEVPDCGGVVAALEATTGRRLDVVVGKPSAVMAAAILNRLRTSIGGTRLLPEEVLVVGDRPETDVALGRAAGFRTALVLTGVTPLEGAAAATPSADHVLAGLHQLGPAVLGCGARAARTA